MNQPALKILKPGAHTSVQDLGRLGFRHLGVPTSGALDQSALRLANRLVGNAAQIAGLEFLYLGAVFEVHSNSVRIALSGAGATIELLDTPGHIFPAWQSVRLEGGQKFKINLAPGLVCCYLAIEGGLDLNPVMGSLSTYARASLGGFNGRILRQGDELPLKLSSTNDQTEHAFQHAPDIDENSAVRITWGQQVDYFDAASLERFTAEEYTILPTSDRMGYRVSGPRLDHKDSFNIVSDCTAVGAIQVPGDGAPIILLADCQTTGGYPKIATVISSDLGRLARRQPGSKIRFEVVSIDEAETIAREHETALCTIENSMTPVHHTHGIDVEALYDANLISGIIDAKKP